MATNPADYRALQAAAVPFEARLAKAFQQAVEKLKNLVPVATIARRISDKATKSLMNLFSKRAVEEVIAPLSMVAEDAVIKGGRLGEDQINKVVEVRFRFDGKNVAAQRAAARQAGVLITRVSEETRQAIRASIVRSIREGIPPYEAARNIRLMVGTTVPQTQAVMNYWYLLINSGLPMSQVEKLTDRYIAKKIRERAAMIARTETIDALNRGRLEGWKQARQKGLLSKNATKRWLARAVGACPICEDLDGKEVPLDEQFESLKGPISRPTAHPHCVVGDTLVISGGAILASSERFFDGDVFVIRTAGGNELSCTSNHPILTPDGWRPANLLDEGSYIVSSSFPKRKSTARDVHHNEVPSRIQNIAKAFRHDGDVFSVPVPISTEDFHNDGEGSNVAIIRTKRFLLDKAYTSRTQHVGEPGFSGANTELPLLSSFGGGAFSFESNLPPSRSRVSSRNLGQPLRLGHHAPFQLFGLGTISDLDARFNKPTSDSATRTRETLGEFQLGSSSDIKLNDLLGRQFQSAPGRPLMPVMENFNPSLVKPIIDRSRIDSDLASKLYSGLAGPVFPDKIIEINRIAFSGHVYNLQTEFGYFVASGIITHNCRCSLGIGEP